MHQLKLLVLALEAAVFVTGQDDVKVNVHEGPTECHDDERIQRGHFVDIFYEGKIDESSSVGVLGRWFDGNMDDMHHPFHFEIGKDLVIAGWEKGLMGLCKGAKVNLIIPPNLGFGLEGVEARIGVPGGATLNYDIVIVGVHPPQDFFSQLDENKDGSISKDEFKNYFERAKEGSMPESLWLEEDKNRDGVISRDEFSAHSQSDEPHVHDNDEHQLQEGSPIQQDPDNPNVFNVRI
eukprot:TRINITY_DN113682_c0_g1_i1.p1 TRINITY_DN113682_c0_g1~~TRINITY_DN113682_c0_g1_i1.p1  ORF type:complete len:236 (+),score=49.68 TRINITY_DN113682_c0_g1_i1:83-790(+)